MKLVAVMMVWLGLAVAALLDAPDASRSAGSAVASVPAAMEVGAITPKG